MDIYNKEIPLESLPFDLKDCREEFGLIKTAVMKCPGIYLLHMFAIADHFTGLDFYVVTEAADIPSEARSYGRRLPTHPDLLFYQHGNEDHSHFIIEYEILKFYFKNNLPFDEYGNLHDLAISGMEVCPSYFGTFPVPTLTPWGYTARYKTLHPGAFWIETDQCKTTFAVSYIMRDDITDEVYNLAKLTPFDEEHGLDQTLGYFFFQEDDICLIVFEIINFENNTKQEMIDKPALMNAIWHYHPEYAVQHNTREQYGENDHIGMIMRLIDPTVELHGSEENLITITPEAGIDFFRF